MFRASLVIVAAVLISTPVFAAPKRELMMGRVTVGDLDLDTDAGATKLLRRLRSTARQMCAVPQPQAVTRAEAMEWRCRRMAMDAAIERLKAPKLTVAYAEWLSTVPSVDAPSPTVR